MTNEDQHAALNGIMKGFLWAAVIAVVALVLMLGSCERAAPVIDTGIDKTGWTMQIVTHNYPDDESLTAARDAFLAQHGLAGQDTFVDGWAVWTASGSACEIHVVAPRYARDRKRMVAMGHELSHCLYGNFHN